MIPQPYFDLEPEAVLAIAAKGYAHFSATFIVNELVSNACKYAYGDEGGGEVRVSFRRDGEDGFRLEVEDDGCGIIQGASPRGTGLGSRLISAMAHSLASTIEYDRDHPGCRAVLVATA